MICILPLSFHYLHFHYFISGIDIVQKIPMHESIAEGSDSGKPIVLAAPKSRQAEVYKELAQRVVTFLNKQKINES